MAARACGLGDGGEGGGGLGDGGGGLGDGGGGDGVAGRLGGGPDGTHDVAVPLE